MLGLQFLLIHAIHNRALLIGALQVASWGEQILTLPSPLERERLPYVCTAFHPSEQLTTDSGRAFAS